MTDIFVAPKTKTEKIRKATELIHKEEDIKKEAVHTKKASLQNLEHDSVGLFSSFHLAPTDVTFKDQEEDEEIVIFLKKHFITNLIWILTSVVILILPIVFFFYRELFPIPLLPASYNAIAFILYFVIVCTYAYINYISWFFNVSLVSQKRIIDVDYYNVFYQDLAVTRLNLIEDLNFNQSGFIRSYLNYGDIYVQTAGEKSHFDLLAVPRPGKALSVIENLMGGDKHDN